MSGRLYLALILCVVAFEWWAKFIAHDGLLTALACVLGLAVIAVRYLTQPPAEAECPPDCTKCADSESREGER
ncbi:hypothetical protein GT045_12825 [Streptomyces sp. SID486]|uniref:hypothetical protein n=1 Tax=Streptomyces sp. SID486 TaxID=2690264 RepID=UPI00136D1C81|nr:hypothetical protein [Streptomyces sp. SID486]MYX95671.1 hypothetical protein [Streptomyces sp. SID486]